MFSKCVGWLYAIIAVIFLVANSVILGMFGYKFGHGEWGKLLFAVVAGSVPWALAPHLHVMAAKRRNYGKRQWFRSALGTIPFIVIYVLFVAYNVLGGTGATAFARTEAADERHHLIGETKRLEDQRTALKGQLDSISKHRPKDAVEAFLNKTKLHPFWRATDECRAEITNKSRRNYCAEIDTLIAEKASATKAETLLDQIAGIDAKLGDTKRSVSQSDPQVEFLRAMTGLTDAQIMMILLLATPLILEAGALYWGKQALELLGIHIHIESPEPVVPVSRRLAPPDKMRSAMAAAGVEPIQLLPDEQRGALPTVDVALQRAILERFWAEMTRPLANGRESAVAVYAAYRAFCGHPSNRCAPLDFDSFARASGERGIPTIETAGVVWWLGFLVTDPMRAS